MKKLLSVILFAAMLVSAFAVFAHAEEPVDKAMLLDDINVQNTALTGAMGYIVNDEDENDFGVTAWGSDEPYGAFDKNGISVAFDLNVLAYSKCSHLVSDMYPNDLRHVSGLILTLSKERQSVIYDIERQEFQIATCASWPVSIIPVTPDMRKNVIIESVKYPMNPGDWHRCFVNVQGTEVFVYCDGKLILSHDFSGGANGNLTRDFIMFWESHCRVMLDNMIVGTDEYDDTLGETFEEKIAANNKPEEDIKNVLFADDFNDAVRPVWDHTEQEPTWAIALDEKGKEIEDIVYEEDGITPKLDKHGNVVKEKRIATDEAGNPIQEVDDKKNPVFHDVHYYNVNGEITTDCSQKHAGFVFDKGVTSNGNPNVPCYGVDKAAYSGMLKDVEGAAISFADTGAVEGQTVNAEITIDAAAGFTEAKNLTLTYDEIFTFKGFENVASGATVTEADGKVNITIPAGFSGKLADLVLEVPKEKEMAQSCQYRYGFLIGSDTEFKNGSDAVDKDTVTIDGGMCKTVNFVKGDANGDGKVNSKDVIRIMQYIVYYGDYKKGKTLTAAQMKIIDNTNLKAADVFPNGSLNSRDVKVLLRFIATGEWKDK